ncbi:MAG: hypothetical protein Q7J35_03145 [Candidatus Methanoperedens sp.]|nr:hypothetical protein [Candidatus Methanoperedens sp.]
MNDDDEFTKFWGDPVSIYTSVMAEQDGILIQTGHPLINYMTHTIHERCIAPFAVDGMWEQFAESQIAYEVQLTRKLIDSAVEEIRKQYLKSGKKADWFYAIDCRGWKLFCAQNETGKMTLMFPEDY